MIVEILTSWNELTVILAAWFGVMSLAVGVDCGPKFLKQRRARAQLTETIQAMAIARFSNSQSFDPDETFQLGVCKIEAEKPTPVRRRHARM